jgi:hypothetical protein
MNKLIASKDTELVKIISTKKSPEPGVVTGKFYQELKE